MGWYLGSSSKHKFREAWLLCVGLGVGENLYIPGDLEKHLGAVGRGQTSEIRDGVWIASGNACACCVPYCGEVAEVDFHLGKISGCCVGSELEGIN